MKVRFILHMIRANILASRCRHTCKKMTHVFVTTFVVMWLIKLPTFVSCVDRAVDDSVAEILDGDPVVLGPTPLVPLRPTHGPGYVVFIRDSEIFLSGFNNNTDIIYCLYPDTHFIE